MKTLPFEDGTAGTRRVFIRPAHGQVGDKVQGLNAGADDCLPNIQVGQRA